jgi:hypothetical protein
MIERVISAPKYLMGDDKKIPLIFLGGPIQGARDWQSEAIKIIASRKDKYVRVANPRRNEKPTGGYADEKFKEQARWERYYLDEAGRNGSVMFWLAREESKSLFQMLQETYGAWKTKKPQRAYAQTSRVEFGKYQQKHLTGKARLVVGIEEQFTGARYIKDLIEDECNGMKIYSTLDDTCNAALNLCK